MSIRSKFLFLIILSFQFLIVNCVAQVTQEWVARYNGPGSGGDGASSIAVDGSGNVYVTGGSPGIGTNRDYATIKYNSSGVQQWVQRYNGPGNGDDEAFTIAVDASGNVYVTGQSLGSGTYFDYATIKYNSSGVQQWVQRYNGTGNAGDGASSIAVDASGNVYVTGGSYGSGTNYDYATIKYNSVGIQQWVQRHNGPGNAWDGAYSLTVDALGNVYVTGYGYGSGTGEDYATIKYNSSGIQQWFQIYNGPGNGSDEARSIALDTSGNVYVTGSSVGISSDYATIKYSQPVGIQPVSGEIPESFSLLQNYPNPFNPVTKIKFDIPSLTRRGAGVVVLTVYDALGREVQTLVNETLQPGTYEVEWSADNFSSGVYYYTLSAGDYLGTKRMVLIK